MVSFGDHKTQIRLHKPLQWTLWKAYQSAMDELSIATIADGTADWIYTDIMDRVEHDESITFPSLKPSIDVFRPPRRSRAHGGALDGAGVQVAGSTRVVGRRAVTFAVAVP